VGDDDTRVGDTGGDRHKQQVVDEGRRTLLSGFDRAVADILCRRPTLTMGHLLDCYQWTDRVGVPEPTRHADLAMILWLGLSQPRACLVVLGHGAMIEI